MRAWILIIIISSLSLRKWGFNNIRSLKIIHFYQIWSIVFLNLTNFVLTFNSIQNKLNVLISSSLLVTILYKFS